MVFKWSVLCVAHRGVAYQYLLAKIGFDTAENGPLKVCQTLATIEKKQLEQTQAADDGIRDVSNVDRMGKDEVTLVNEMIQGILDLIAWEKELEANTAS